jgi:uncharacterized protein
MIRVVIDTNIWLRYLIKPGATLRKVIEEYWLEDKVQLITSPHLVAELEDVLARDSIRALIYPEEGDVLLRTIQEKAELTPVVDTIPDYTRDRKDDKFIACALLGQADYLITLDKDILILGSIGRLQMVIPVQFVSLHPIETL